MGRKFNVVIEKDEDGFYIATVPSLSGCHIHAKGMGELPERVKRGHILISRGGERFHLVTS